MAQVKTINEQKFLESLDYEQLDGLFVVRLDDFGGVEGTGNTLLDAYEDANSKRHSIAYESGVRGTGASDED